MTMENIYPLVLLILTALNFLAISYKYINVYMPNKVNEDSFYLKLILLNGIVATGLRIHSSYFGDYLQNGDVEIDGYSIKYLSVIYAVSCALILYFYIVRLFEESLFRDPAIIARFFLYMVIGASAMMFIGDLSSIIQKDLSPPFEYLPTIRKLFVFYNFGIYPILFLAFSVFALMRQTSHTDTFIINSAFLAVAIMISVKLGFKYHFSDFYENKNLKLIIVLWQEVLLFLFFCAGIILRNINVINIASARKVAKLIVVVASLPPLVIASIYWIVNEISNVIHAEKTAIFVGFLSAILTVVVTKAIDRVVHPRRL